MVNLTQIQNPKSKIQNEDALDSILSDADYAVLDEIFVNNTETEQEVREIWKYIVFLVSTSVNEDGCYEEETIEQYFGEEPTIEMIEENLNGWLSMGYEIEYITHYSTKRYNQRYGLYETVWSMPIEM